MLAGYDEAGGAKGYMPVDHSKALEKMGGRLSSALRASWLPKISNGWFFRAESFFSVARYMDEVNLEEIPFVPKGTPPDFLSHSHGEGFLRFFQERCQKQGIFIFDEPESALSSGCPETGTQPAGAALGPDSARLAFLLPIDWWSGLTGQEESFLINLNDDSDDFEPVIKWIEVNL